MANPSLDLRGGASGPTFEGSTPGHVLTVDANGKTVSPQPVPAAPGGLTSFNGRNAPAAVPTAGDYGTDEVTNTSTVPGLTAEEALESLADEIDAVALEAADALADAAAAQATANAAGAAAVTADGKAVAAQQPFLGTYFVNPAFAGTQTGSQSNPFTTIAAAFAFAASLAITKGIIFIAPGANCVENVTFPLTGEWQLASQISQGNAANVSITGNIDISASASARRSLKGFSVAGNITGNCSAGTQRVFLETCSVSGTVTLTGTGAGVNRIAFGSPSGEAFSGFGAATCFLTGAVAITGTVNGSGATFTASLSFTGGGCLVNCLLPPTTTLTGVASATLYLFNSANALGGALAFTASGGGTLVVRPDGVTLSEFERLGLTLTGNISLQSMLGARASISAQGTNVGVTPLTGRLPAGLMVCEACLTLLTNAGATTGNAVLNVVYTDATGTLVTEAVTTALDVAGAVGSKARGVLPFSQNGSASVSWSVTGITNATSLTYRCEVAIRQAS